MALPAAVWTDSPNVLQKSSRKPANSIHQENRQRLAGYVGFSYTGSKWHLGNRSCLVAQRLPIPLRIVCGPYSDSAIWKVVTSPSRLSYRPPGSVLESRCGSLSQVLKADRPNWFDEGSAGPVASKNRLAASTR